MTARDIRVIKLGGSLLGCDRLAGRIRAWLAAQGPAMNVLIVGGGAMVEAIREADRVHGLSAEAAHWLAIRAMSVTADLVSRLLPEARLVGSLETVLTMDASAGVVILDVRQYMEEDRAFAEPPLPCSWQVTSDSIAARIAAVLEARELVFLKSTLPERPWTVEGLSRAGYFDGFMPQAATGEYAIRAVDLSADDCPQVSIERG